MSDASPKSAVRHIETMWIPMSDGTRLAMGCWTTTVLWSGRPSAPARAADCLRRLTEMTRASGSGSTTWPRKSASHSTSALKTASDASL